MNTEPTILEILFYLAALVGLLIWIILKVNKAKREYLDD